MEGIALGGDIMKLPPPFNCSFEEFVSDMYGGSAPSYNESETREALSALAELWPDRLHAMVNSDSRGSGVIAPILHQGIALAKCRGFNRFDLVLMSIRAGNRSALSQAMVASKLVTAGYQPEFEVPLLGKVLDISVPLDNGHAYLEVCAAEQSELTEDTYEMLQNVATAVRDGLPTGVYCDIELDPEYSEERLPELLDAIRVMGPTAAPIRIGDLATILVGTPPSGIVGLRIPKGQPGPRILVSLSRVTGDVVQKGATVGAYVRDERAEFILRRERDHFSREHTNLLIIDTSSVIGGGALWLPLFARRLQPSINTRFGGIALFDQFFTPASMRIEVAWNGVINPFARRPLPDDLMRVFNAVVWPGDAE